MSPRSSDRQRSAYVNSMLRMQTMVEIGGSITFDGILRAAVERAKKKCLQEGRSASLYGTWHQHNGTKSNVFDEFRAILRDLGQNPHHSHPLIRELDQRWGTGASLYFS